MGCSLHAPCSFPSSLSRWLQLVAQGDVTGNSISLSYGCSTLKNLEYPCLYHGGPEDPPSIPMIRHHHPLKMEKGTRVSTLAKSSARKMELGQGREIIEAEKKKKSGNKKSAWKPIKGWHSRAERQPSEEVLYLTLDFVFFHDQLILSSSKQQTVSQDFLDVAWL